MALTAFDVHHKRDAARIVLEARVIQPALLGQAAKREFFSVSVV
jgi:hypothetical protein